MLSTLKAVIFDMDGLMLDTEPIYRLAWQQAAAELGYTISDDLYASLIGRPLADCQAVLLQILGEDYPYDRFKVRSQHFCQQHAQEFGIEPKAGLGELLDHLDEGLLLKAVATSTARREALDCLGQLALRFDTIVAGDEVANGKPAPDIFLLAAERLAVAPERCLVLEDSEAGAQAALAAGMNVIIVPDLKHPPKELAARVHRVCASLHEVRQLFLRVKT